MLDIMSSQTFDGCIFNCAEQFARMPTAYFTILSDCSLLYELTVFSVYFQPFYLNFIS